MQIGGEPKELIIGNWRCVSYTQMAVPVSHVKRQISKSFEKHDFVCMSLVGRCDWCSLGRE